MNTTLKDLEALTSTNTGRKNMKLTRMSLSTFGYSKEYTTLYSALNN